MTRVTRDDYMKQFGLPEAAKTDIERALAQALEIRKFEIELYWKRAAYFWAFLAITLGGYGAVYAARICPRWEKGEALLAISCFGVVFAVAWYFVNRASKFWQENWENHVDLLEDAVAGPLYKTVVHDAGMWFLKLNGPYPFSVSKVNQLLSLFVVVVFSVLAGATVYRYYGFGWPPDASPAVIVGLAVVAVTILWCCGRTRLFWNRAQHVDAKTKRVCAVLRRTEIV